MRRQQVWRQAAALMGATVLLAAGCSGNQPASPSSPSSLSLASPTAPATSDAIAGFADGQLGFAAANVAPETVALTSLSINPSVFLGGESTRGTATLNTPAPAGGLVVTLASDDTAAAVPAAITLAEGATSGTFAISTRRVASNVRIHITASAGGVSLTATLELTPVMALASLGVESAILVGGDSTTGTATLTAAAPGGGMVVTLRSSNEDARVPASMTVAAGSRSGTFTIETHGVSADTEIRITGSAGGRSQSVEIRLRNGIVSTGSGSLTLGGKID